MKRVPNTHELAELFEGRSRFVERLAELPDPLDAALDLVGEVPDDELVEALEAHPQIGAKNLSERSAREQGPDEGAAVETELAYLNQVYEEKFGFRFVVFVNRRPKSEIADVLRARLERTREDELATAVRELVAIA
ncbi:MAG TPA: 2-oxo-4-hydroxy-4-carboxy-5-ureidoimidazoline decarboxylase, partial [Gaiellaceae bacterium]|nr:2-oxo-4-hydroxy-4-carboxy-5-ureidoimidazoline decarboxylase [Gaiellaceae bacterium]